MPEIIDNEQSKRVFGYKNGKYDFSNLNTVQDYMNLIQQIDNDYRFENDEVYGSLVSADARAYYRTLYNMLSNNLTMSYKDKKMIEEEISYRISIIPEIEKQKYTERRNVQKKAFRNAKDRFKRMSLFKKISLRRKGLAPSSYLDDTMNVQELDAAYTEEHLKSLK